MIQDININEKMLLHTGPSAGQPAARSPFNIYHLSHYRQSAIGNGSLLRPRSAGRDAWENTRALLGIPGNHTPRAQPGAAGGPVRTRYGRAGAPSVVQRVDAN